MIARVLAVTLSAFFVGAIAIWRSLRNADAAMRRERWTKYAVYFGIVHGVIFAALSGRSVLLGLFAPILGIGGVEVWRVGRERRASSIGGYGVLALALIGFLWTAAAPVVIYVFVVIAAFDGFSQAAGNNFGRHRLAPRISPGKTIEGSVGGLAGGVMIGVLLHPLVKLSAGDAALASALLCVAGLAGDLLASQIKRMNGVKDFGALIPAHGGVLDRFDSLLVAGSAWWLASMMLSG